ncbi:MAG: GntR family transcriptional regulator [Anaerolineaceae bacterium]|nr:GntR family transcriptional regulator [Anaerolineaceae bacterium]
MSDNPSILDKSSYMPLYRQLYFKLLNDIQSGKWSDGEQLPSERALEEIYQVSRITARQAVEALVKAGVVYREKGRGTFVANSNFGKFSLNSFSSDTIARGKTPSSKLISFERKTASEKTSQELKCKVGEEYFKVIRIRLADDKPIALQIHRIIGRHFPNLSSTDLEQGSLFELMRKTYGIVPAWTEPNIQISYASEFEAHHLLINTNDPLLSVESTTYTDTFELIEWVKTLYRSDGLVLFMGRQRIDGKL